VQKYITRIKEINPFINAVVDDRFTEAIIEARNYDQQLKEDKFDIKTLEKEKPLYGVPITIKECCAVKGKSSFFILLLQHFHLYILKNTYLKKYTEKKALLCELY